MFYRLSHEGLAMLIGLAQRQNPESIYNLAGDEADGQDHLNMRPQANPYVGHPPQNGVIKASKKNQKIDLQLTAKTDFALYDLREEAEYEKFHILECSLIDNQP